MVQGSGFRVQGSRSRFKIQGSRFRDQGFGFVLSFELRVEGFRAATWGPPKSEPHSLNIKLRSVNPEHQAFR
jgi:hypothetical protein